MPRARRPNTSKSPSKALPLFRGDAKGSVAVPEPESTTGIVPHVLYLGGAGRSTRYTSVTDAREVAVHFAGPNGRVWSTDAARGVLAGARHISRQELTTLLKGFGRGDAKWTDAFEVAQARVYVERCSEHLLDWRGVAPPAIAAAIGKAFE